MKLFRPAAALTLIFVVLTGLIFPVLVWGIAQLAFPHQANGSLARSSSGSIVGSDLLGQQFTDPKYFHPRPSAAGAGYDAANSAGSNLGPTNPKLIDGAKALAVAFRKDNGLPAAAPVPVDAVTSSGSGLDPDISVENARLQVYRIASARGMDPSRVSRLLESSVRCRWLDVFGEPRVNVLALNLSLDDMKRS